jgi:hypothetical protein
MKAFSMFLTTAILFAAPMVHAKMVQVPEGQAKELKEALAITPFNCSPAVDSSAVVDAIYNVQSVYLDDTASQPILKFIRNYDGKSRLVFTLTTTSDFKKIGLLVVESQNAKLVNRGSLIKPQLITEFVTMNRYACK